jgi:hypothetical protein
MAITESIGGNEQVDLKKDLHRFIEAISPMGREFGLNPQLRRVRPQNARATYEITVATITESGLAGRLKQIVGAGDIVTISQAPPVNGGRFVDYVFAHKSPLKDNLYLRIYGFVLKVERKTGVRIYLTPKDDMTQWENE